MSKEYLEAFNRVIDNIPITGMEEKSNYTLEDLSNDTNLIKQALLKAQEQEKVLKIIKEKNVLCDQIKYCDTVNDYNELVEETNFEQLLQEEFNTLKEWLKKNE